MVCDNSLGKPETVLLKFMLKWSMLIYSTFVVIVYVSYAFLGLDHILRKAEALMNTFLTKL